MKFFVAHREFKKIALGASLLLLSILIGVLGFTLIEGFGLVDAFYMAIITFSTVGFNEVVPLSQAGRFFTSFYIIFNLLIFAYVVSVVSTYIFEGEFNKLYKKYLTGIEVSKMENHVIVIGFGRNGSKACEELAHQKEPFIIVEKNDKYLELIKEVKKFKVLIGDISNDEVLINAGIKRAKALITTLPGDADNILLTLTAKELNPEIIVISRATEEKTMQKLKRVGADHVIMPDAVGGVHMAQHITKPFVIEYLDQLSGYGEDSLRLEEVEYAELKSQFRDKTIGSLDIRNKTSTTVVGLKDKDGPLVFNPSPHDIVHSGMVMIIIGKPQEVKHFKDHYLS
jgi:voltage-gated potassium channel